MNRFIIYITLITMALNANAQNNKATEGVNRSSLPTVYLPDNVSLHFVSPEPIQYVDISTKNIVGDLPLKNVLRIKKVADTAKNKSDDAVVTIAGEKFIAQYHIIFTAVSPQQDVKTDIDILPEDTRPLDISGIGFSQNELRDYSLRLLFKRPENHLENAKAYGIKAKLNHICSLGDYIFLDVSFKNETNLKYTIDELRFKIDDKKITKATNVQSVDIKPDFMLFDQPFFKKYYRNIFVFKKFSFPGNKVLRIEMSEKQLSGRIISLKISYKDVLDADIIQAN